MNKTINLYIVICISILYFGCDKEISIPKINSKPVLSINALIDNTPFIVAKLSSSESIQQFDTISPITDAIINIHTDDGSFNESLISQNDGTYALQLPKIEQKTKFIITSSYKGYPAISASTVFYPKASLFEIDTSSVTISSAPAYKITVHCEDQKNIPNYYVFETSLHWVLENGQKKSSKANCFSLHPFVENKDIQVDNFELSRIFISDLSFDGQSIDIPYFAQDTSLLYIPTDIIKSCDLVLDIISINKDVYQYFKAIERFENLGESNFPETIQIPSNIENGTGVFGTFSSVRKIFKLK